MRTQKDGPEKDWMGYYRAGRDIRDALEKLSEDDDRPRSWLVRTAIRQYLKKRGYLK